MENEEIFKKIKKLIAMQSSSNVNESTNAAKKIKKILNKYNLDIDQIKLIKEKKDLVDETKIRCGNIRLSRWKSLLADSISKYYDCKYYYRGAVISFIGFDLDRKTAIEMYKYLVTNFKKNSIVYVNTKRHTIDRVRKAKNLFLRGAVSGLSSRLVKLKEEENISKEMTTSLIVVKEKEISSFMSDISIDYVKTKTVSMTSEYFAGMNHGETVSLHGQIN